eukprot:g56944.t1
MFSHLEDQRSRNLIDQIRGDAGDMVALPQIAVVGDTSAGKSSVLSALSGFEFPSAAEICTRCPIQLRLSRKTQLRVEMGLQASPSDTNGKGSPDQKQEAWETFATLEEASKQVKGLMDRAALNSSKTHGFSRTMVVISAEGPDMPDLTLIDLPGLVRSSKDQASQEQLIGFVRSLLLDYIKQPRTVILAVLAANVDIHNQEVLKLAKDADPEGTRTLAVLTKPDLMERNTEDTAHNLMTNQAYPVNLGWAAVKCRDRKDRDENITIKEGRQKENAYFEATAPWKDLPNKGETCGSEQLVKRLQTLLRDRIEEQLPGVMKDIQRKLAEEEEELKKLGPELGDPIARRLAFDSSVSLCKDLIRKSAYDYGPDGFFKEKTHRWRAMIVQEMLGLRDEISDLSTVLDPKLSAAQKKQLQSGDKVVYLKKNQFLEAAWDAKSGCQDQDEDVYTHFTYIIFAGVQTYRGSELPGFLSFPLFSRLFDEHIIQKWPEPTEAVLAKILDFGENAAREAVKEVSGKAYPNFLAKLDQTVVNAFKHIRDDLMGKLTMLLQHERAPSTKNHYFFENVQKLRWEPFRAKITSLSRKDVVDKEAILNLLNQYSTKSNEVQEVEELLIMFRAYTKVAMKRFVDNVEQIVVEACTRCLSEHLAASLMVSDPELEQMFMETALAASKRVRVKEHVERLSKASKKISAFKMGYDHDSQ